MLAHAFAKKETVGLGVSKIDCPRSKVVFYDDKVTINDKEVEEFSKLTNDLVNSYVAEELRKCWYKTGEGELDIFKYEGVVVPETYTVCLVCSEIIFDKEAKQGSYDGLIEYLNGNELSLKGEAEKISYFDYLVRKQRNLYLLYGKIPWTQWAPWSYGTTNKISEEGFDVKNKYYIYYMAWKPTWLNEKIKAFTSAQYIGLGTIEKLSTDCSYLYN